jgi:tetratricopeptide (TPR) repeat protein
MSRTVFMLILAGISLNNSGAWDPDSVILMGNDHYVNNEFEEAITAYQAVIDSGYESASLYFNLGNAFFKTNQLTMALVNYERALILDPRDEEILHNQELAHSFLTDEIDVLTEKMVRFHHPFAEVGPVGRYQPGQFHDCPYPLSFLPVQQPYRCPQAVFLAGRNIHGLLGCFLRMFL